MMQVTFKANFYYNQCFVSYPSMTFHQAHPEDEI